MGRTSSSTRGIASSAAPRFFAPEPLVPNESVSIGEDAARHMRVLRLGAGASVVLLDGKGARATGRLRSLAKRNATIEVDAVETIDALPVIHVLVPIADRDRMLLLAEKVAELSVTSWRPVLWKRSRSVSPRGEGPGFQGKVTARMISALEQSGNTWLPATYPDATLDRALASLPDTTRIVLDRDGDSLTTVCTRNVAPLVIAIGPEGGLEESELAMLGDAGFRRASIGPMTLRFETAGIAAVAHARTVFAAPGEQ